MSYESAGDGGLDYFPCRYGTSRNLFRGPKRDVAGNFIVVFGGSEVYGKFVREPFPDLMALGLGSQVLNLGAMNGSVDLYLNDPDLIDLAQAASVTVIQISGAHNLNNRFYKVHPRRNDRFVKATALSESIFTDVDFMDFNFTKHMLTVIADAAPDRFGTVVRELREAWVARMNLLISEIGRPVILVWLAADAPPDATQHPTGLGCEPCFVTRQMVDALRPAVTEYVEVIAAPKALAQGTDALVYGPLEREAAKSVLPAAVHAQAADALIEAVRRVQKAKGPL